MKKVFILASLIFGLLSTYAQNYQTNLIKYASTGLDSDSGADLIDFDGDGLLDIWTGFESRHESMVYHNLGNTFHIESIADTVLGYFYCKTVDFNQDGYDDMLMSVYPNYADPGLYMYINDGNYNYTAHFVHHSWHDEIEQVEFADMDNDGDLDMVVDLYANANFFYYIKNEGNNTYSWSYIEFVGQPAELYGVADLNNDSLPDVLGAYYNFNVNDFIVVAAENDTANNTFIIHEIDTLDSTQEGVVADFIGDALPDLILSPVIWSSNEANVWRNDGNFSFSLAAIAPTQNYCRLYMANDYDNDGDMDALSTGIDGLQLLRNNGNGNFSSHALTDVYTSRPAAWKDINNDGLKDILTNGGSSISVLLQNANGTYDHFWSNMNGGSDRLLILDADLNGTNDIICTEGGYMHIHPQTFDEKRLPVESYTPDGMPVSWGEWRDAMTYDFDNDGDLDILVGYEGAMYIVYNNNGTYNATNVSNTISYPNIFRKGDLDQDGNPDFIINGGGIFHRFEWNGSSFTETTVPGSGPVYNIMDVDQDGDEDIIHLNWNVSLGEYELNYQKNTNNSFTLVNIMNLTGIVENGAASNDARMVIADIDDDGDQDLFVTNHQAGTLMWWRNDSLTFVPFTLHDDLPQASYTHIEDMDNDGDLDVVAASANWGRIYVFDNDGAENFTTNLVSDEGGMPVSLEVADYDKDGDLDIFTTSAKDNKVVWVENLLYSCENSYSTSELTICQGDSFLFGANYISAPGFYYDTFVNAISCDSVHQLVLSVNSVPVTSLSASVCPGDSAIFAGNYYATPGTYYDTLTSFEGCDSVIQFTLQHYNVPTLDLTQNGNIVSVQAGYAYYEWFLNGTLISNENTPSVNAGLYGDGIYTSQITLNNGCIANSTNVDVVVISIQDLNLDELIVVYPNPASDKVIIEVNTQLSISGLELYQSDGAIVDPGLYQKSGSNNRYALEINNIARGIYVIHIQFDHSFVMKRIIVQ